MAGHGFVECGCETDRMNREVCAMTRGTHHHSLGGSLVVARVHPHRDGFRADTPGIIHGTGSMVPQGLSSLFSRRKVLQVLE